MAMKPETRYYVLLGKLLSAIKNSSVLENSVITLDGTAEEGYIVANLSVAGKQLIYNLSTADAEKIDEQEIVDTLMGLYNVTD